MCSARSASANPTEFGCLAPHPIHALPEFGDVGFGASHGCERGGPRFDDETNLRKVAKEALVDARIEMPCEHVGIEHVPGAALPHHGADPRLGAEQAFGNQRLHALAQHRPRHPEHRDEFGVAGQPRPLGITAGDDVDANAAGHFGMIGMRAPGGDDDKRMS